MDDERFKKMVHLRKENNKYEKQQTQKKKTEVLANIKKAKAEERMHRIVVKGRKIMQYKLVSKGTKKRKHSSNSKKENDEINMLFYETSD